MSLCVYLGPCGGVGRIRVEYNRKHWEVFEDRENSFFSALRVVYGCAHVCAYVCAHEYVEPVVDIGCLPVFLDSFVLETGSQ